MKKSYFFSKKSYKKCLGSAQLKWISTVCENTLTLGKGCNEASIIYSFSGKEMCMVLYTLVSNKAFQALGCLKMIKTAIAF